MSVDRDRFLEEGYLILPNVIPQDKLDELRSAYERLVDRQRTVWAQNRRPGAAPGGEWETSPQPRLNIHHTADHLDETTIAAVDVWLYETTQGVSSELLGVTHAAVTELFLMCNPVRDHGPQHWHRDMYPANTAPLQVFADDIVESGPRYVQWNIPLYDDDVLWVIPGSHVRINTPEEDAGLLRDSRAELPGAVQTHLRAGDGVVYILPILHWPSNYTTKLRRTIHGGFSARVTYPDLSFLNYLQPKARETFERWQRRGQEMGPLTEAVLRAAMQGDADAYYAMLDQIHPGRGPKGCALTTVNFCRTAKRIHYLKQAAAHTVSPTNPSSAAGLAEQFTMEEADRLWDAFKGVEAQLLADTPEYYPGFQGGESRYRFLTVPNPEVLETFLR